jgi:hypothetical protein
MKTALKKLMKILFVFIVITAMAVPQSVFAQDALPTSEPVATDVVVADVPTEVATSAATETPVVEETAAPTLVATEVATEIATEVAATETPVVEVETVAEVVDALAEGDVSLVDENGNPLVMGSIDADEDIVAADPWFVNPADPSGLSVIAYMNPCPVPYVAPAPYTSGVCTSSITPVQSAINAAPNGSTVHLGAGIFNEQITFDNRNLTLVGSGNSSIIAD